MSVVENGNTRMLMNSTWQVDPALSAVEFRVRSLMIATVKRRFRQFDGAIVPFPEIRFQSTTVHLTGDDKRFLLVGELTMKDVTRHVTLAGVFRGTGLDPEEGERIALTLRSELDRTDFGLSWNRVLETGGVLFGTAVELALDVSAVRGLVALGVGLPAAGFAVLPAFLGRRRQSVDLGPVSAFPEGKFVVATFLSDPAAGEVSRRTAYVRGPAPRALDRYQFSIRSGRLVLGELYSVSRVEGTGAAARIGSFKLKGAAEPATGPESLLYPLDPSS
jgi:polyisoprenoid-binding protein YceI